MGTSHAGWKIIRTEKIMTGKWWTGAKLKEKGFDIIDLVQMGLQPHNEEGIQIVPPELAEVFNRHQKLKLDTERIEQMFSEIQKNSYAEWRTLNKDREVDWNGNLKKIFFLDGSDSEIREEYQSKKAELERLEPIVKQYPNMPSWEGYKRPMKPKDIIFVENLLLSSYFKTEDCIAFLEKNKNQRDKENLSHQRPSQEAKEKAVKMAKEFIDKALTKKKTPVMRDAVHLIQKRLLMYGYKNRTVHDWIKGYFPPESRNPGRPKKR